MEPTTEQSFWQRQATTIKGVLIFILMLVLLIPTAMIDGLISERQGRQQEAVAEVSSKWGQSQTLSGPVLVLPYQTLERSADGKEMIREIKYAYFLPDELTVNGQVNPEKRHRAFLMSCCIAKIILEGSFSKPETEKLIPAGAIVQWEKATLAFGIPDLRGLEDPVTLQWNGQPSVFEPGIPVPGVAESGIHVPLTLDANTTEPHRFRIEAALKGSGSLFFTPLGKVTSIKLTSLPQPIRVLPGPLFFPDEKTITASGFEAPGKC